MHPIVIFILRYILIIILYVQAQITEEERAAFIQTFEAFGQIRRSNCRRVDGHITSGDLKTVLKKLGQNPTNEETAEFVRVCDVDKNGEIEFNEFCRYLVELRKKVRLHLDHDQ